MVTPCQQFRYYKILKQRLTKTISSEGNKEVDQLMKLVRRTSSSSHTKYFYTVISQFIPALLHNVVCHTRNPVTGVEGTHPWTCTKLGNAERQGQSHD